MKLNDNQKNWLKEQNNNVIREELERKAREQALNYCYGDPSDDDYDCFAIYADSDPEYINAYNEILEGLLLENKEIEDDDDVWIR